MTKINRMIFKGFKSFANRTELIYGENFNMIIGVNGAGKSNLCDGLCFVLGKSSAKGMRAEKTANLIFNGGKKGAASKEASVTIEFDNPKKTFPIDSETISITRTVKDSGVSTYKINDETRTRQEVLDLLGKAKIDPDGHNIILQGDIVHFMEMKGDERREIIEEISGISIYEDKKHKCLLELQKVEEKLKEANIILTEREANLRELKKERDQAKRFKELQEELKDYKGTYLHHQIKDKETRKEEIESRLKKTELEIDSEKKELEELKSNIQELKEKIKQINKEIEEKGEKEQIQLRKQIDDLKEKIIKTESRVDVCSTEIERINARKSQISTTIGETKNKVSEINKQKQDLLKKVDNLQYEDSKVNKKIQEFKEKQGIPEDFKQGIDGIEKNIENNLYKTSELEDTKRISLSKIDQINFQLSSIQEKIDNIKGIGSSKELKELNSKKEELKVLTKELTALIENDSGFAAQLSKARANLQKVEEDLAKVEARQTKITEYTMADVATKNILKLKSQFPGVHGTVSQLGEVDSKYALALEVAAGSRILSLVVDNENTAHKCINYLKENKLGIATFLPLNKVRGREEQNIKQYIKRPGVEGMALDLVQFDQQYKNIFSHVFGSTVVVKDLNIAKSIGVGGVRMVTLEGDLVETSGAMVGGYRGKRTGLGFKEKDVSEKLISLQKEAAKLQNIIAAVQADRLANEDRIRKLRENRANLEVDVIKLEGTLNIKEDVNKLLEEQNQLKKISKEETERIKGLQNEIDNNQKIISKIKIQKQEFMQKLQDPAITKGLEEIENQKAKIREQIIETNSDIKNINNQIKNILQPELEKSEKIILQYKKELEDFQNEGKNLKQSLSGLEKELKEKQKEEEKYHGNLKELINERNKITERISKVETKSTEHQLKIQNIEQRKNNISIDKAKIIAELEALQKEFEEFKDCTIKRGLNTDELRLKVKETEHAIAKIGSVNMRALEVYEEIEKEYNKLIEKATKLQSEKDDVMIMLNEVENKKKAVFMKTYNEIVKNFKRIFSELTTKGEAFVELENPENPFEGGLDIQVRLQGNKYLDIKSLSGGEKTMAALSFIFAIQEYEPSPFYFLDEVDAALDKRNSSMLTHLIQKYSKNAQYIVISHNDSVITEADQIYGISMQDGISKVVSLKV